MALGLLVKTPFLSSFFSYLIASLCARERSLVDGVLFKHGFTHPILTCVSGDECTRIMAELHEGICGSHVGGRSLASKVVRAGLYWPTVKEDCVRHAQRCKQCQKHADWHKAEELRSIYSPWPFHMKPIGDKADEVFDCCH